MTILEIKIKEERKKRRKKNEINLFNFKFNYFF